MAYRDKNIIENCIACNKEFVKNMHNQKICSEECRNEVYVKKAKEETICVYCKNKFLKKYSRHVYCSNDCCKNFRKKQLPSSESWALSIEFISERDGYTCCDCKRNNDVKLVVHHKIPLTHGGGNEYDNLILLCEKCHSKRHSEINKPV